MCEHKERRPSKGGNACLLHADKVIIVSGWISRRASYQKRRSRRIFGASEEKKKGREGRGEFRCFGEGLVGWQSAMVTSPKKKRQISAWEAPEKGGEVAFRKRENSPDFGFRKW